MRGLGTSGYILVTVLGVMLTVTGLIASASVFTHAILRGAIAETGETAMTGLVTAGMELTAYQLFTLKIPMAAVNGRRIRLAGATIEPAISDEAGKIDVNTANIAILESAFQAAGLSQGAITDLSSRISAWRGGPSLAVPPAAPPQPPLQPLGVAGAPAGPPAKHTPFRSVEDFIAFAGLAPAETAALAPLLTVYNTGGTINVMTADRRVLMALPGMTGVAADDFIAQRAHADVTKNADRDNLLSLLQNQRAFITTADGPVYRVAIAGTAPGRVLRGVAYIAKSVFAADPYLILQWGD